MGPWTEYPRFAISLFAILTPFAAVPPFLSITKGLTAIDRSRIAASAAGTAALVLVLAALSGEVLLSLLGASLGSLRVGGGLVLLFMAFSMMNPRLHETRQAVKAGGIVPIGLPMLAGPGSISAVMVEARHGTGLLHLGLVIGCVAGTCAIVWAILRLAQPIGVRIGQNGLNVLSRVFGLLLAAVAIQIITQGLRVLFPVLG